MFPGPTTTTTFHNSSVFVWGTVFHFDVQGKPAYARSVQQAAGLAEEVNGTWSIVEGPGTSGCVGSEVPPEVAKYFNLELNLTKTRTPATMQGPPPHTICTQTRTKEASQAIRNT